MRDCLSRLVRERTARINRIKGLLFAQGVRGINIKSQYKTLAVDQLVTGDGHRLPPRLVCEVAREIQRLAMVQEQIAKIKRERDTAPTPCEATERKRRLLLRLKSIGPAISALLSREVYYRQFANLPQQQQEIAMRSPWAMSQIEAFCHPRFGGGVPDSVNPNAKGKRLRDCPQTLFPTRTVSRPGWPTS